MELVWPSSIFEFSVHYYAFNHTPITTIIPATTTIATNNLSHFGLEICKIRSQSPITYIFKLKPFNWIHLSGFQIEEAHTTKRRKQLRIVLRIITQAFYPILYLFSIVTIFNNIIIIIIMILVFF